MPAGFLRHPGSALRAEPKEIPGGTGSIAYDPPPGITRLLVRPPIRPAKGPGGPQCDGLVDHRNLSRIPNGVRGETEVASGGRPGRALRWSHSPKPGERDRHRGRVPPPAKCREKEKELHLWHDSSPSPPLTRPRWSRDNRALLRFGTFATGCPDTD